MNKRRWTDYLRKRVPGTPSLKEFMAFIVALVVVAFLVSYEFIIYPVSVLLTTEGDCNDVRLTVDGRARNVEAGTLFFRLGRHVIAATREGCEDARLVFVATDSEQGSRDSINLTCKSGREGCRLSLKVE